MTSGYSGTPLAKKLGLKPGQRVSAPGAPPNYRQLLAPLPEGIEFQARVSKLVDIKVCAVDETWSGLKLVLRKELRKK